MTVHDPDTPDEWQTVALTAAALLRLDTCRRYGLIVGGPVVNRARCEAMIAGAARHGIVITDEAIDAATLELVRELSF